MSRFSRSTVRAEVPVVVEEGPTSWGVFAPSVPGVIAVGRSREEALVRMQEAMSAHFAVLDEQQEDETRCIIDEATAETGG